MRGFLPLIAWENKYQDKLLISFPSFKYRKFDIIARPYDDGTCIFWKIDCIKTDPWIEY